MTEDTSGSTKNQGFSRLKFQDRALFGYVGQNRRMETSQRGTSALHLNESTWIIDGSNELIVDFLFALVLFLDSTQPRPFKNPKQIFFLDQTNE